MTLPLSRDLNAADGDELPSASYNNVQDCIIDLDQGKHTATRFKFFPASAGSVESGGTWVQNRGRYETSDGTATGKILEIPLPLEAGSRIVHAWVHAALASGAATFGIACHLEARDLTAISSSPVVKNATPADGNTAGNCTVPVDPDVLEVIDDEHAWHMRVQPHASTASLRQVFGVLVEYDHP